MAKEQFEKIENWKADLLLEKRFRTIIRRSFAVVGGNLERNLLLIGFIAVMALGTAAFFGQVPVFAGVSETQRFLAMLSTNLITVYSSLLGFVLAGFAIIISLFSGDVFKALASFKKITRPFSEFKFIYFSFIYTLSAYGAGLLLAVFCLVFSIENGLAEVLIDRWPTCARAAGLVLATSSLFWFVYSLLLLKSLIWNLYQLIVTSLITEN